MGDDFSEPPWSVHALGVLAADAELVAVLRCRLLDALGVGRRCGGEPQAVGRTVADAPRKLAVGHGDGDVRGASPSC